MGKSNVLVVEDESIIAKDIQNSLKKLGYNVVGTTGNGEEAVEMVDTTKPDIVLMDVMLKGEITGIQAVELIRETHDIPVIYLTAYADEETLAKAKGTNPQGYLLKPFKEVELHTAIEMALFRYNKEKEAKTERELLMSLVENADRNNNVIFARVHTSFIKIWTSEILYAEANKDYVTIYTEKTKYSILSTLSDMENRLSKQDFIRTHRSYIVRLDKIACVNQNTIVLDNSPLEIPVGGAYKAKLKKRLNMF